MRDPSAQCPSADTRSLLSAASRVFSDKPRKAASRQIFTLTTHCGYPTLSAFGKTEWATATQFGEAIRLTNCSS